MIHPKCCKELEQLAPEDLFVYSNFRAGYGKYVVMLLWTPFGCLLLVVRAVVLVAVTIILNTLGIALRPETAYPLKIWVWRFVYVFVFWWFPSVSGRKNLRRLKPPFVIGSNREIARFSSHARQI